MRRYEVVSVPNSSTRRAYEVRRTVDGELMCLCLYRKGAERVCAELNALVAGYMGAEGVRG